MVKLMIPLFSVNLALAGVLVAACSHQTFADEPGSEEHSDSGEDAGLEETALDGDDGGNPEGDAVEDGAQSGCFTIVVPEGAGLCTASGRFCITRLYNDVCDLLPLQSRVVLREGEYCVPVRAKSFELPGFFGPLQVGLDHHEPQQVGDSACFADVVESQSGSIYRYECTCRFDSPDLGLLEVGLRFDVEASSWTYDGKQTWTLDDESIDQLWNSGSPPFLRMEGVHYNYVGCGNSHRPKTKHRITTEGGDTVGLTEVSWSHSGNLMTALLGASWSSGGTTRETTDPLHLATTPFCGHHTFVQDYLFVFEEPAGDTHGLIVTLTRGDIVVHPWQSGVNFINEDCELLENQEIVNHEKTVGW